MKIGLSSIGFGTLAAPAFIRTIAMHAERLNFSTVWAPEHVVLLDRYTSRYPYSTDGSGQFLAPTEIPIGDPFSDPYLRGRMHESHSTCHRHLPGART
jgi:hypothetical protein